VFDEKSPTLIRLTRAVFGPPTGARARLQDRLMVTLSRRRAMNPVHRPDVTEEDTVFLGFLSLASSLAFLLLVVVQITPAMAARSMADIPDRFVSLTVNRSPPTRTPLPAEIEPTDDAPQVLETQTRETTTDDNERSDAHPQESRDAPPKTTSDEPAGVEASYLLAALMGTLGESGTDDRVRDLFEDDDPGGADLDRMLADVSGVQRAGVGLSLRRGVGTEGRADIGEMARHETHACCIKPMVDSPEIEPTITGQPEAYAMSSGNVDVLRSTIRRQIGQIKACYERSLKSNPNLQGRMELDFAVEGGQVLAASVIANETGDEALATCVVRQVTRWRFPDEVTADITWPLIFTH